LLPLLGWPVHPESSNIDETPYPGEAPRETALRLAELKALAVAAPTPGEVVIGSDSVVELDGQQFGKPLDALDATRMLHELRGRPHRVITAVVLRGSTDTHRAACETRVGLRQYDDREIRAYIESGQPLDKAGAYAIQDKDFAPVAAFEGCYLNAVGLPLCEVWRGLRGLGWDLAAECFRSPCRLCKLGQASLTGQADAPNAGPGQTSTEGGPS
jgi:MAF protein